MAKPDYAGETLAVCRGSTLSLYRGILRGESDEKVVLSDSSVLVASWNRNNKVMAAARGDGAVELLYGNGAPMSILPRDGHGDGCAPLTSLSWSMGSKRLAAGCLDGSVHIHDMVSKTFTRKPIMTPSQGTTTDPVTVVEYHPDDYFLAAAGRCISLFSISDMETMCELELLQDQSGFTCLSVGSGSAPSLIAAGTARGAMAVWDSNKRQVVQVDSARHIGGATAVQFAPLDPSLMFTAGSDGQVLMQDLREGPFQKPTLRFESPQTSTRTTTAATTRVSNGSGIRCLCVREDYLSLAVGMSDGRVVLYDPKNASRAATVLQPSPSSLSHSSPAVTCVDWQHNYQSLSGKSSQLSSNVAYVAPATATAKREALNVDASKTVATSIGSQWGPPNKLDGTPIPAPRPSPAAAAVSIDRHRQHPGELSSPIEVTLGEAPRRVVPDRNNMPARGVSQREGAANASSGGAVVPRPWSIKAVTPGGGENRPRDAHPATALDAPHHDDLAVETLNPRGSPSKAPFARHGQTMKRTAPGNQCERLPDVTGDEERPESSEENVESLRKDVLALHLDMLNHFQEQQAATAALVTGVMQRQEALAEEVGELRRQLQSLLARRDGALWL